MLANPFAELAESAKQLRDDHWMSEEAAWNATRRLGRRLILHYVEAGNRGYIGFDMSVAIIGLPNGPWPWPPDDTDVHWCRMMEHALKDRRVEVPDCWGNQFDFSGWHWTEICNLLIETCSALETLWYAGLDVGDRSSGDNTPTAGQHNEDKDAGEDSEELQEPWPDKRIRLRTFCDIIRDSESAGSDLKYTLSRTRTFNPPPVGIAKDHSQAFVFLIEDLVKKAKETGHLEGEDMDRIRQRLLAVEDEYGSSTEDRQTARKSAANRRNS